MVRKEQNSVEKPSRQAENIKLVVMTKNKDRRGFHPGNEGRDKRQ